MSEHPRPAAGEDARAARGPAAGLLARPAAPGRALPRLAAAAGHEAAARLAEAMLLDAAAALRAAPGWRPALFAGPAAAPRLAALAGIGDARPLPGGDEGRRALAALRALAADGGAPVAVAAADAPLLAARHLAEARAALREADAVFGPSAGGGFYLAAMWEPEPALFEDPALEWDGPRVLSSMLRVAKARGMRVATLAMERRVAAPADLAWLRGRLAALEARGEPPPAHTAEALRALAGA